MDTENKRKPRLHELLAVEQDLKGDVEKARRVATDQFTKGKTLFVGLRKTFRPWTVDEARGEEPGERLEADTKLAATVPDVLDTLGHVFADALDVSYQIERTNTRAHADIVVDGKTIAEDVPATFLLQLEKRLRALREVLEVTPTFDPVKVWNLDHGADRRHVFRADPIVTVRKQRTRKYNVMVEPTREHPAQVDVVEVDEAIGEVRHHEWTGMLAPATRTALLARADALIRAVKEARSRANGQEVDTRDKIGRAVTDHILDALRNP